VRHLDRAGLACVRLFGAVSIRCTLFRRISDGPFRLSTHRLLPGIEALNGCFSLRWMDFKVSKEEDKQPQHHLHIAISATIKVLKPHNLNLWTDWHRCVFFKK